MNSEDPNLCEACLSRDRKLVYINRIRPLLVYLNITELQSSNGCICFECYNSIIKFNKFRCTVQDAQDVLKKTVWNAKSLSTLKIDTINYYDYEFTYHDPLESKVIIEISKPICVKQETLDDTEITEAVTFKEEREEILPTRKLPATKLPTKRLAGKRLDKSELQYTDSDDDNDAEPIIFKKEREEPRKRLLPKRLATKRFASKKDKVKNKKISSKRKTIDIEKINEKELLDKIEVVLLSEEEMIKHREDKRNHHNFKKIPYKCDSCVLGFIKKENYDTHMAKKHDESIGPACDVCLTRFPKALTLKNHRAQHYHYYKCKFCDYKCNLHVAAVNHVREKHAQDSPDRIHCRECGNFAGTQEQVSQHMKEAHKLTCDLCGEKFKAKNTLRIHQIRTHAHKRQFSCDVCKKTFSTKSRLESHMTHHSSALAKKMAYCSICDVQYLSLQVYRNHLKNSLNHIQEKYPCPECGKSFASKSYYNQHYNFYHLKQSKFKCEECDKLFLSNWRLINHKQVRHGMPRPRDHGCTICGKRFYTKRIMRAHMQIHSSQRTHMCAICGDTFKQSPALYTHQKLVHSGSK